MGFGPQGAQLPFAVQVDVTQDHIDLAREWQYRDPLGAAWHCPVANAIVESVGTLYAYVVATRMAIGRDGDGFTTFVEYEPDIDTREWIVAYDNGRNPGPFRASYIGREFRVDKWAAPSLRDRITGKLKSLFTRLSNS